MGDSARYPLLHSSHGDSYASGTHIESRALICPNDVGRRFVDESKKIWAIAGPAIFSRITMYSTFVITQAFAGHIGELELAVVSIGSNILVGFSFGLFLGMGSALETLCGQAFGARNYRLLGLYMQRAWIVLFGVAILLLPIYFFVTPILKLLGQPDDIAELTGRVAIWFIPQHFSFVILFPVQRFLQSQLKNMVIAWIAVATLILHVFLCWLFIIKLEMGLIGLVMTLNFAWWMPAIAQLLYSVCGGCPSTWTGLSKHAFCDLWAFVKLSLASGVMLCLENWYYRVLMLLTGNLPNPEVAVDSLSICMSINGWEMMIPLGFFASTGVRVANELGAGNGKGAKFAVIVSAITSTAIGLMFCVLVVALRQDFAAIFTTSSTIIAVVSRLSILLSFTILFNSIQPVLSGVAVGSGWQSYVAYINIGSYYIIGVPLGVVLGWLFHKGVLGIWTGMICGTAVQTLILAYIVYRCDWDKQAAEAIDRVDKLSPNNILDNGIKVTIAVEAVMWESKMETTALASYLFYTV